MTALRKLLFSFIVVITVVIFLFFPKGVFAVYDISVSNLPQSININNQQDIDLEVIVKLGESSEYYLRAAFSHSNSPSAYFGYTDGYNGTEAKSFYKINTNDNGEWGGILKIKPDVSNPYFKGEGTYNFRIGYYTAAGNGPTWKYENTIFLSYPLPSPTSTPTLSPSSSPTPTSTITPTPKPVATYKINEVKDEDGEVLFSVKVYVDGIYLHHYVPEVLTFCDGCQCDIYVACGFGQHTIKLEKTGYNDWNETKTINSGDFDEVSPVMVFSEPNSTTTSTPKILTPTQKISPTPTLKKSNQIATGSGEILGEESASFSAFYPYEATEETKEKEATSEAKNMILPKIFMVGGLLLLFISASWLWYNFKN